MTDAGETQANPEIRKPSAIRRLGREEVEAALADASAQGCDEIVLLGPGAWTGRLASAEGRPGRLVFQVRARCMDMPSFRDLRQLRSLTVADLAIDDTWATAIASNLKQLTSLDLSGNRIGNAGATAIASNLKQLTSLNLRGNRIGDAGATAIASNLKQLTSLGLSDNSIGDAGATAIASNLRQLISLNLSDNRIGDAGATAIASNLKQLTSLDLNTNGIGDAGATAIASTLRQLTSLYLNANSIGDAGATTIASTLRQLTSLYLSANSIGDAGATAIASTLEQLTSLDLSGNSIGDTGATAIASNLKQLTSLRLSANSIGDAGATTIASDLERLTSLYLSVNSIGDAGATAIVTNLKQLTSLDLGGNSIGDAGATAIASTLKQLTSLYLWNNSIGDAGATAIASTLERLTSLDLSGNSIGEAGAKAIASNLKQLTSLDLSRNSIGDAGVTAIATNLKQLTSLDLSGNRTGQAGTTAIATNLKQLTSLGLNGNRIGDDSLKRLAMLPAVVYLDITRNAITNLSHFESWLWEGMVIDSDYGSPRAINVRGCPLRVPTLEVVNQGPAAVLNYFRELRGQGSAQLFEAKVMLLGEGGSGKTSLLRRLYFPGQLLPEEEQSTRGIEIHPQQFKRADGGEFRLNVWDFGGQQIYHATHQFFLTKNALYVLVDDTRKDCSTVHDEGFKYWLEVVETFGANSPLLIFQNEKSGRSKKIDEAGIKGRFPNVRQVLRGDLIRPEAADGIRRAIEQAVQDLPHVGEAVPAKWVEVRAAIEDVARTKPHISQQEYLELYGRILEPDRDKALHLSRYLHDLGVFLHFQDDERLGKTVIVQNRWATEAVFRVLDDEKVKGQLGLFDLTDCARAWKDSTYADMHMELRALMEKFELCYRLPDTSMWLVPQLLSPSTPKYVSGWASASDLVLTYRYEFLPKGLVSRLMVRKHRLVAHPELCWSNGALFEYQDTQLLALTESKGSAITLRARGPEKKALLSAIAFSLDDLNSSFRGLEDKVRKWVPCSCAKCRGGTNPEFFEEKRLAQRRRDGKLKVECPSSYEDVSVLELLDGVSLAALPDWAKDKDPVAPENQVVKSPDSAAPKVSTARRASLGWLHVSDLHQGLAPQRWLWPTVREELFVDLPRLHKASGPWDVVFFTGDLTQKGSAEEFASLNQTLEELWKVLRKLGSNPILLTVPGNHDLVRPKPKSPFVVALTQSNDPEIISDFWDNEAGDYRRPVTDCFKNYTSWVASHPFPRAQANRDGLLPGDFSATIAKHGVRFGIVGLNSTFLQLVPGDCEGKLALDPRQLHAACEGDGATWSQQHDFCFLLTHHPPQWLGEAALKALQGEIAPSKRIALHLFGHMHTGRAESLSVGGAAPWRRWQGSSLFGLETWGEDVVRAHGYSAGRLDVDASGQGWLRQWPRVAMESSKGVWRIGPDVKEFELLDDGGTKPEPVEGHKRAD